MKLKNSAKWISRIGLAGSVLAVSSTVLASGLTVPFGAGVPALAEARGGGAAIADDASTNYTNSAGLIRVDNNQFIISAFGTTDHKKFSGSMTNPGLTSLGFGSGLVTQTGTNSTNVSAIIPNFHYVHPINERWAFGISFLTPYGLGLYYPNNTITRYEVMNATQKGFEISPSLAWAMTPKFSLGLGADILYYSIRAKTAVNLQPLTPSDGIVTNEASSYNNFGWHAGLLYQPTPCTRFGASYRSAIVTHNGGTSRMYIQNSLFLPNGMSTANNLRIVLPLAPLAIFSAYHDVTSRWAIMGSAEYEGWSIYKNDHSYNVAGPTGSIANVITPTNYRNTWYFGLGTNYKLTDAFLVRGGIDYIPSFVSTANRQILITDPPGYGFGLGLRYKQSPCYIWDVALTHSFYKTVALNHTSPTTGNNLNGISHETATSIGAQLTWNML